VREPYRSLNANLARAFCAVRVAKARADILTTSTEEDWSEQSSWGYVCGGWELGSKVTLCLRQINHERKDLVERSNHNASTHRSRRLKKSKRDNNESNKAGVLTVHSFKNYPSKVSLTLSSEGRINHIRKFFG
jgi:hypothetical protein